ncbi:MAG: 2-amino-4-hydroxy-6-hydroxymethyldihydropteridine diphosphokinase, partial [Psychroflexus halocasei]
MNKNRLTYIAIGSNQGDKLGYLQKAISETYTHIGDVLRVSKVYDTPAWGFEGDNFYNACLEVRTRFSAEDLLQKLLSIELSMGRKRIGNSYANRPIDLDIVFYESEKIATSSLQVPHPRLAERKFVLYPLADLIPDFEHPILKSNINDLKKSTEDDSEITVSSDELKPKFNQLKHLNFLAIEGNIGSGKTSLST